MVPFAIAADPYAVAVSFVAGIPAPPPESEVALSVYELPGTSSLNVLTELGGLGGAYHVSVEVYWLEWSYGFANAGTGVSPCHIGDSSLGTFKERVPLGRTRRSAIELLDIIAEMRETWVGQDYDLLSQNCAHFAVELIRRLGVDAAPKWIYSLADVGERLARTLGMAGAREAADLVTPAEKCPPPLAALHEDELDELVKDGEWNAAVEKRWREARVLVLGLYRKTQLQVPFEEFLIEIRYAADAVHGMRGPSTLATANVTDFMAGDRGFRAMCHLSCARALGVPSILCGNDRFLEFVSLTRCVGERLLLRVRLHSGEPAQLERSSAHSQPPLRGLLSELKRDLGRSFLTELRALVCADSKLPSGVLALLLRAQARGLSPNQVLVSPSPAAPPKKLGQQRTLERLSPEQVSVGDASKPQAMLSQRSAALFMAARGTSARSSRPSAPLDFLDNDQTHSLQTPRTARSSGPTGEVEDRTAMQHTHHRLEAGTFEETATPFVAQRRTKPSGAPVYACTESINAALPNSGGADGIFGSQTPSFRRVTARPRARSDIPSHTGYLSPPCGVKPMNSSHEIAVCNKSEAPTPRSHDPARCVVVAPRGWAEICSGVTSNDVISSEVPEARAIRGPQVVHYEPSDDLTFSHNKAWHARSCAPAEEGFGRTLATLRQLAAKTAAEIGQRHVITSRPWVGTALTQDVAWGNKMDLVHSNEDYEQSFIGADAAELRPSPLVGNSAHFLGEHFGAIRRRRLFST